MQPISACPGCKSAANFSDQVQSKMAETFQKYWTPSREKSIKHFAIASVICAATGVALLAAAVTAVALLALPPLGIALAAVGVTALTLSGVGGYVSWRRWQQRDNLSQGIQLKELHSLEHFDPNKTKKPVALLLQAKEDHNGALHSSFYPELEPAYTVVSATVEDSDSIIKALKKIPKEKVGLVCIQAHGQEDRFLLSRTETEKEINVYGLTTELIENGAADELLTELKSALPEGAPLILESCSTGACTDKKGRPGLARLLSEKLANRPIFAPRRSSWKMHIRRLTDSSHSISMCDILYRRIHHCFVNGVLKPISQISVVN